MDPRQLTVELSSADRNVRWSALQDLDRYIESDAIDVTAVKPVLDHLAAMLGRETEYTMQERVLYDLSNALGHVDVDVVLEPMIEVMPKLSDKLVQYALTILGMSLNANYQAVIESYLEHSSKGVRDAAHEALSDLAESLAE